MLSIIEAARTKWPDIADGVAIRETNKLSVTCAVLGDQLFARHFPWMVRRPDFSSFTVALEPVGSYWLGYNAKHSVLWINFAGEHHAN